MSTVLRFLLAAIALLATGCAAPMSKVVSTRQGETIDQHLFKEGDKVKVTYADENGKVKTKKGRVLHTDDDSVTLSAGLEVSIDREYRRIPLDLEYRRIHTFSRPIRVNRWFGGLSAGTFIAVIDYGPQELPGFTPFTGAGCTLRYAPYSNRAFEVNILTGKKGKEWGRHSKWLAVTLSAHVYTIIPRTYFILGAGGAGGLSPIKPQDDEDDNPGILRIGLGVEIPVLKRFNIRLEADLLGGLKVDFERRLR